MNGDDERFMERAFDLAEEALRADEVPVGCVIVRDGEQLAVGHNETNASRDPTRHAEIVAFRCLERLCVEGKVDPLLICSQSTVYVTLEPCIMCAAALHELQFNRIVYGAANERFGGLFTVADPSKYGTEYRCQTIRADSFTDRTIRADSFTDRAIDLLRRFYDRENPFAPSDKRKSKRINCD